MLGICLNSFWYGVESTFFNVSRVSTITAKPKKSRELVRRGPVDLTPMLKSNSKEIKYQMHKNSA
jgi:hypothetical protein